MKKLNLFQCALILLASLHTSVGISREPRLIDQLDVVSDVRSVALSSRRDAAFLPPLLPMDGPPAKDVVDIDLELRDCRMPGEFEHQRALLLAANDLISNTPEVLVDIVRHAAGKIEIILLVSNVEDYRTSERLLRSRSIPMRNVRFAELPHNTMWARDYGPIIVRSTAGRAIVIDAGYDLGRPNDDLVPQQLAHLLNLPVVQMPLRLDGGNLLSNGDGLALTTERLFAENGEVARESIRAVLRGTYGLKRLVALEPLAGEPTGHVDMFASFTSADTVVVGQYDPLIDPENAAILDRNAERLAQVQVVNGPLRVVRIPMPRHDDSVWRTYTNVIFANRVLMMPTYAATDLENQAKALATYARLLPGWNVVGIDATRLIESDGALHCVTMNLGPIGKLPKFPRPRAAVEVDFVAEAATSLTN